MTTPTTITAPLHLTTLLNSTTHLILDFNATWCGPCKAISPLYASLATTHALPGRLVFAKVDVDAHPSIAKKYNVSAMPTFLFFKNGAVTDTLQGADAGALKSKVNQVAEQAKKGPARAAAAFQSKGRVLGGETSGAEAGRAGGQGWGDWLFGLRMGSAGSGADTVVRFLGLYVTSLLSLDAYAAAEASPFNVRNRAG